MKSKLPKLSFKLRSDFFSTILVAFAVVFVWRGLWNLMDTYFFPGYPLLSDVLSVLLGLLLLYLPDEDIKELV